MAILALATDLADLEARLARIIVGSATGSDRKPIRAGDLKASGAMTLLLKDAIRPNLVQTLEGGPAFVHAGPFANIAHGCNSILATKAALERGLPNLEKHIENVRQFGVPVIVAVNRFVTDTERELRVVAERAQAAGAQVAMADVWEKGGAGGEVLARAVLDTLERGQSAYAPLYPVNLPIRQKIDTIVKKVYGGDGADFTTKADRTIDYLESIGMGETPVCMAKTQYSLTDDATILGRPSGFRITVNEVFPAAGAGFVVAQAGDIMTMPGLPKEPAAERMAVRPDGSIVGLF
jgi:formate--tetrahydrofolate ligase